MGEKSVCYVGLVFLLQILICYVVSGIGGKEWKWVEGKEESGWGFGIRILTVGNWLCRILVLILSVIQGGALSYVASSEWGTWCLVHESFVIHLERYMRLCDWDTFWAKLSSVSLFIWNAAVKIGTFDGFVVNLLVHSFWIVITIDKETILICFYCTENLVVVLV